MCELTFPDEATFVSHRATHSLKCSDCEYKTNRENDLDHHRKKHNFKCENCSYHAIHQKDLRRHGYSMHPKCNSCSYMAKNIVDLVQHKSTTHEDPVLISCIECGFVPQNPEELRIHIGEAHKPKHRTRIFSARRPSTSTSVPKTSLPTDVFRPWSSSSISGATESASFANQSKPAQPSASIPKPFTNRSTDIPDGFLRSSSNAGRE